MLSFFHTKVESTAYKMNMICLCRLWKIWFDRWSLPMCTNSYVSEPAEEGQKPFLNLHSNYPNSVIFLCHVVKQAIASNFTHGDHRYWKGNQLAKSMLKRKEEKQGNLNWTCHPFKLLVCTQASPDDVCNLTPM